jgi:FkbM family methyltransferase
VTPGEPRPTEADAKKYANRSRLFEIEEMRPDDDWRDVLDVRLAEAFVKRSQGLEELAIRDFFGDREGGFFLDVGCAYPRVNSTTFYLEDELAWTGIGIDVRPEFGEEWRKLRPSSKFVSYAVADTDGEKVTLYLGTFASLEKSVAEVGEPETMKEVEVTTITLNTLLEQNGVAKVDFLSMDIEGAEPAALRGFDIQRYKPDLCCVETAAHRDIVLEYFANSRYEVIEKYRKLDKVNLYFRPITTE